MKTSLNMAVAFLILLVISVIISKPTAVSPDSAEYAAYIISAVRDGNLYFGDEFEAWEVPPFWNHPVKNNIEYIVNSIAVGPAILWSPFYLFTLLAGEDPMILEMGSVLWIHLSTLLFGALMFAVIIRFLKRNLPNGKPYLTIITLIAGTPLIFYLFTETINSHVLSGLAVALFVDLWDRIKDKNNPRKWFLLGFAGGLAALIRWQELIILVIPVASFIKKRPPLKKAAVYAGGAFIALLPQLMVWTTLYNSPFLKPQQKPIYWLNPDFFATLVSSHHGLLFWTPLYSLIFIGLIIFCIKKPAVGIPLTLFLTFQIYVNSAFNPHGGRSFGIRRLTDCSVISAAALSALFACCSKARSWFVMKIVYLIAAACSIWTLILMLAFRINLVPGETYVTYGEVFDAVRKCAGNLNHALDIILKQGLLNTRGPELTIPIIVFLIIIAAGALIQPYFKKLEDFNESTTALVPLFLIGTLIIAKAAVLPANPAADWTENHKRIAENLEKIETALKQNPDSITAIMEKELLYFNMGNYEAALDSIENRLKNAPASIEDINAKAACLMYLDRFDEAETMLRQKIKEFPDYDRFRHYLGVVQYQTGRLMQAKETFLDLWTYGNRDRKSVQYLADCYRRLKYHYLQDYFQAYIDNVYK